MTPEQLAELAMEIESQDNIDWGMLLVSEKEVFLRMAEQLIETMNQFDLIEREAILMASVVKLLAENFALHAKMHGRFD